MSRIGGFAVAAAQLVPRPVRAWVHRRRTLDRLARRIFGGLLHIGSEHGALAVQSGPMAGLRLPPSEHISHAHLSGAYERETIEAIMRLVEPGMTCYDLGASIGYVSLAMAKHAAHVYCFEPAPHAAHAITQLMEANGFTHYTVVRAPVSDTVRTVRFAMTDVAYGSAIVAGETRWPVEEMVTMTLDGFSATHESPDLVKIDVEGEEDRVLAGASKMLAAGRTTFVIELHSPEDARQVRAILEGHDYAMTTLGGKPVEWDVAAVQGETHIIATPPARQ